jgi:hypothetical protein
MTLVAVENKVQELLDGQVSALFDPAQAYVHPPTFVFLNVPQLFVWGSDFGEERHTMPRLYGEKRIFHKLTIWIQATTDTTSTTEGSPVAFEVLIDAVAKTLRSIPIPIPLIDPYTGETSVMQTIGEKIDVKHPAPVAAAPQSTLLWNNATMTVHITEEITG